MPTLDKLKYIDKIENKETVPVSVWRNIAKEMPITKGMQISNYNNDISKIAAEVKHVRATTPY